LSASKNKVNLAKDHPIMPLIILTKKIGRNVAWSKSHRRHLVLKIRQRCAINLRKLAFGNTKRYAVVEKRKSEIFRMARKLAEDRQ
jgi:hypothetical protein